MVDRGFTVYPSHCPSRGEPAEEVRAEAAWVVVGIKHPSPDLGYTLSFGMAFARPIAEHANCCTRWKLSPSASLAHSKAMPVMMATVFRQGSGSTRGLATVLCTDCTSGNGLLELQENNIGRARNIGTFNARPRSRLSQGSGLEG